MEISRKNALEILGLNENYTEEELKKSYRRLSKLTHPDAGGDANLFRLVSHCIDVLNGNAKASTVEGKERSAGSDGYEKPNRRMTLSLLYEEYDVLYLYTGQYNLTEISGAMSVKIMPVKNKNQFVNLYVSLSETFEEFYQLGFVHFRPTISIPDSLRKYKRFKVKVEFLDQTHEFKITPKRFMQTIKKESVTRFNTVVDMTFAFDE